MGAAPRASRSERAPEAINDGCNTASPSDATRRMWEAAMVYAVLRQRPDASLKARESGSRSVVLRKLWLEERIAAFAGFWARVRYESWVPEERAGHRRTLIEDNPTSG